MPTWEKTLRGPSLVKNYVQLWLGVQTDGMGSMTSYTWATSLQEAQEIMDGWSSPIGPTMYYVLLNKFNVQQMVLAATGLFAPNADGSFTERAGQVTTNGTDARAFDVEKEGFATDTNDPQSVKAAATAKKIIAVTGKTKVGTFTSTVYQALVLTINSLKLIGQTGIAGLVQQILNQLVAGRITPEQALAKYEIIVASRKDLFT